ncbi:MAG: hypothetical protein M1820_008652 [Bogoriella megaspora]|nr:MAG: hypothetical protein M1820_008652 [Bogoriella megaspora]
MSTHKQISQKTIQFLLRAPYPGPYTPFWGLSTLPSVKLPPTTSSYLWPYKSTTRLLQTPWSTLGGIYSIYYFPFGPAQEVLGTLHSPRYWAVRQRQEERGKRSEAIDQATRGGGGGLWWTVNKHSKQNVKPVVRSWISRRIKIAFKEALREAGFDAEGIRISSQASATDENIVSGKEKSDFKEGNLTGTLCFVPGQEARTAPYAHVMEDVRSILAQLMEIRRHQQQGYVKNKTGKNKELREQTWREAKESFFEAMKPVEEDIARMNLSKLREEDYEEAFAR